MIFNIMSVPFLFLFYKSEGADASGYHAFPCFALHDVKDHLKV